MSVQIFLLGKIVGIDGFLYSAADSGERLLVGRSRWVTLLSEVLPRALLAELGLARVLLGASGGGQFLLVLPQESRAHAEEFLRSAAMRIDALTRGDLRLIWAATENLGDWTDVRKRLNEELDRKRCAPAGEMPADLFQPFTAADLTDADCAYFTEEMVTGIRESGRAGWSSETPERVLANGGKHVWPLGTTSADAIPFAGHAAPADDGPGLADRMTMAARAEGSPVWGVLRGDVDNFGIRIRRAQSIEEHLQLSVVYKQFFAGELEVACSMPEFWRKVTILYSGGDDFAVYGAWDALVILARELQRLFHRLAAETLRDYPGPEGKTITMALALAPEAEASLAAVYEEAGRKLEVAKSADKDCVHLLGRTLEWRQMAQTSELKDLMARMVTEFGCPPQFLSELAGFYRESPRAKENAVDRPWRLHRRLNRVLGPTRDRELTKLRTSVLNELAAKGGGGQRRLRSTGRVALEWAKLSAGV
jgi:CRISPR-associated protein Csm1